MNTFIQAMEDLRTADFDQIDLRDFMKKVESALEKAEVQNQITELHRILFDASSYYQDRRAQKPDIELYEDICELVRRNGTAGDVVRFEFLWIYELIRNEDYKQAFDLLVDITPKVKEINLDDLSAKLNQLTATLLLHEDRDKEAEPFIDQSQEYYEPSGNRIEILKTLHLQVTLQWLKGDYVVCRRYLQRILDDYQDIMTPHAKANAWSKMGNILNRQGEDEEAINCLSKARDICEQHNLEKTLAGNLLTLGNIYMDNNHSELALEYYQKSAEIYDRLGSPGGYASSLNNVGLVYMKMRESEKAREYYEKALGVYLQGNLKRETVPLLNNLSIVCQHTGQINKAVDYVRLSYDTALEHGNKYELIETINVMSYMLAEDAHNRKDIKTFDWIEERLEEARKLIDEIQAKKLILWHYRAYADMLDSKGLTLMRLNQFEEACEVFRKSSDLLRDENMLRDQHTGESMAKKVEEVTAQLELKLKKKESEELEKINTDLKEANKRLMQQGNEMIDLERRNSALAMAVTANHEINQPLMVIQGNLELLVASLGERNLTEKEKTYLKRLNNSVNRIQKILERYRESNQYVFDFYSHETKMVTLSEEK